MFIVDTKFQEDVRTGECKNDYRHGNNMNFNDIIAVNGVPWPVYHVLPRLYRLRSLIGSTSRSFHFFIKIFHPQTYEEIKEGDESTFCLLPLIAHYTHVECIVVL